MEENKPPTLSMVDLKGLATVLSLACDRGAFRITEMTAVGKLHDRLAAYIKYNSASEAPPAAPAPQNPQTEFG
jgi:hypothetical protein